MSLYHSNRLDLQSGDLVQPGNWGTVLQQIGPQHNAWNREMVLEAVRSMHFPNKPSRLHGTFSCEFIETIRCYNARHCPQDFLYEVEIVDPAAPCHKGDFNAVEPKAGRPESMGEIAVKYWLYSLKTNVAEWPSIECSEILSASPLRILTKL